MTNSAIILLCEKVRGFFEIHLRLLKSTYKDEAVKAFSRCIKVHVANIKRFLKRLRSQEGARFEVGDLDLQVGVR